MMTIPRENLTQASNLFSIVKRGLPIRRGPHYIPVRRLERFIRYSSSIDKLCNSIAYSLSVPLSKRDTEEWCIFLSVSNCRDMEYLALHSLTKEIRSFSDIVAVDFSILNTREGADLMRQLPQLKNVLLSELNMVIYGRALPL